MICFFIKDIKEKEYFLKIVFVFFVEDGENCGGGYFLLLVNDDILSKFYLFEVLEFKK